MTSQPGPDAVHGTHFHVDEPKGSARSRIAFSVMSVATPDICFGHDTQIAASGLIRSQAGERSGKEVRAGPEDMDDVAVAARRPAAAPAGSGATSAK
jgi:hypothetical protein